MKADKEFAKDFFEVTKMKINKQEKEMVRVLKDEM